MMLNQDLSGAIIDDRYKIVAPLGQGGMGVVYKALEIGLERELALKFMHICHLNDAESRTRFEREGKVLASLKHRHIVSIYRFAVWNNQIPYLVMEYLPGETLREILDKHLRIPPDRALHIAIQLCQALEYAHNYGVIHRDIKPGNILVLNQPETDFVKIVDFGLMKLLPESWSVSQKLTQTGLLIGTTQYLSPEQCLGKYADQRSDIYSLAVMIYESIAGVPPLDADNPIGIMHKHANEMPLALSRVFTSSPLPEGLDFVLKKALQKDPNLRYQTAAEFQEALVLVQSGKGKTVSQKPESSMRNWAGSEEEKRPSQSKVIAIGILSIALVLLFGYTTFRLIPTPNQSAPTNLTAQNVARRLQQAKSSSLDAEQYFKLGKMSRCAAVSSRTLTTLSQIPIGKNINPELRQQEFDILVKIRTLLINPSVLALLPEINNSLANLSFRYKSERRVDANIVIMQIIGLIANRDGDLHGLLLSRGDLSRLYLDKGEFAAAGREIQEHENLIKKHHIDSNRETITFLQNKAGYLLRARKDRHDEARKCLHDAYEILLNLRNETYETILQKSWEIGYASIDAGDFAFAERVILNGRELVLHQGRAKPQDLMNMDNALVRIERSLGHCKEAKKYCLEEIELRTNLDGKKATPLLLKAEQALEDIERLSLKTSPKQ